jgi:hypothetical protein
MTTEKYVILMAVSDVVASDIVIQFIIYMLLYAGLLAGAKLLDWLRVRMKFGPEPQAVFFSAFFGACKDYVTRHSSIFDTRASEQLLFEAAWLVTSVLDEWVRDSKSGE